MKSNELGKKAALRVDCINLTSSLRRFVVSVVTSVSV